MLREGRLADGHQVDNVSYQQAIREVADLRLKLAQTFRKVDILLTPCATRPGAENTDGDGQCNPSTQPGTCPVIQSSLCPCSAPRSPGYPSVVSLSPASPRTICCWRRPTNSWWRLSNNDRAFENIYKANIRKANLHAISFFGVASVMIAVTHANVEIMNSLLGVSASVRQSAARPGISNNELNSRVSR